MLRQLEEQGEMQLTASKEDQILGDPQWDRIRELTNLNTNTLLQRYLSKLNNQNMHRSQLNPGESVLPAPSISLDDAFSHQVGDEQRHCTSYCMQLDIWEKVCREEGRQSSLSVDWSPLLWTLV